jgi:hypothetical protein
MEGVPAVRYPDLLVPYHGSMSTFGTLFRVTSFGESHGKVCEPLRSGSPQFFEALRFCCVWCLHRGSAVQCFRFGSPQV